MNECVQAHYIFLNEPPYHLWTNCHFAPYIASYSRTGIDLLPAPVFWIVQVHFQIHANYLQIVPVHFSNRAHFCNCTGTLSIPRHFFWIPVTISWIVLVHFQFRANYLQTVPVHVSNCTLFCNSTGTLSILRPWLSREMAIVLHAVCPACRSDTFCSSGCLP